MAHVLLLDFVHKRLQCVIKSLHEASQMDWGGGPGELGDISDIQVVLGKVLSTVLDNIHHKVSLEVNRLVTVGQLLVPEDPGPPLLVHCLVIRESDFPDQVLGQPEKKFSLVELVF